MTLVSETLALKIENLSGKLQLLEWQWQQLAKDREGLLAEAAKEVGATPGHVYHQDKRCFTAPTLTPFSKAQGRGKRAKG